MARRRQRNVSPLIIKSAFNAPYLNDAALRAKYAPQKQNKAKTPKHLTKPFIPCDHPDCYREGIHTWQGDAHVCSMHLNEIQRTFGEPD